MEKFLHIMAGIFFIIAGLVPIWIERDITFAIFMIPLGIFVLYVSIFKTDFKTDK